MFLFSSVGAYAVSSADIIYLETDLGAGLWQYDYTFYNTSTAGEYLYSVFLDFDHMAGVTRAPLPTNWAGIVWEGINTTPTLDTFSLSNASDIAANGNLGGFSFTVDYQAGSIPYTAYFSDHDRVFDMTTGTTAVAPEPISSILFLSGGAILAVRRRLMKKTK
ncbi:MAG: hypothetical protein HY759_05840 [Nitrospirae bacterium]|nr:hypothetical protein [Nitrospirota bacterium]